ncbi:hypothetical protein [Epilithonimonas sp.]|uniref:hypothetical protein n=1 Tax=Epilithonimonas sp. TaxID=2894511 RepID=UPI0028A2D915|nr:hypothetical protein [Epilithonimonas sp.]
MRPSIFIFIILFSLNTTLAQEQKSSVPQPLTEEVIVNQVNDLVGKQYSMDAKQLEVVLLNLKAKSEKIGSEKGILGSGRFLMSVFDKQGKDKEVVELGNQLIKIVQNKKEDPKGIITDIYQQTAQALMYLGLDDAGKKDLEMSITFAKTIENPDKKYFRLSQNYIALHTYYNHKTDVSSDKKYRDSTIYYINRSLESAKK